ncbi:MAG: ABC transporter permease [Kibdelosporangium sp.]
MTTTDATQLPGPETGARAWAGMMALAIRLSVKDYRAEHSTAVLLGAILPRALFQLLFLVMLGGSIGGRDGLLAAAVGASAYIMVSATIVKAPSILVYERIYGTMYRLRMTDAPLAGIIAARWLVYVLEGLVSALLGVLLVTVVLATPAVLTVFVTAIPVYVLMALTSSAFGMVVALSSLGRRGDVVFSNLASYVILAFGGVVVPWNQDSPLATVAEYFPMTNGILALRDVAGGAGMGHHVFAEALVGFGWSLLAIGVTRVQVWRLRRSGADFLS